MDRRHIRYRDGPLSQASHHPGNAKSFRVKSQAFYREDGVEIPTVAFPGKLSATPADYRHRPPKVGEQSREVLADWLPGQRWFRG